MKNPNGPSVEDKGEWAGILEDQEEDWKRRLLTIGFLMKLANRLEATAETLTDREAIGSEWGNLQHDVEILRMAVRILERQNP